MRAGELFYRAAERRIEYFAVVLGAAATMIAVPVWGGRAALGVGAGALLSWLNFRWLKQGVAALVTVSTAQAGAEEVRVPKRVYLKFLGRYASLIVVAYVILRVSSVPALALLSGLFAIVAAVLMELLYELSRGWQESRED